jgi:hypothetical protein
MEKIMRYIKNGKGVGMIFLLAAAVLLAGVYLISAHEFYASLKPKLTLAAEDFLPITVENHQIVSPLNVKKSLNLDFGSEEENTQYPFVVMMDTTENAAEKPDIKQGVALMHGKVYVVQDENVRTFELNDGVVDMDAFVKAMDSFAGIFFVFVACLVIAIFFVRGLLFCLILALCGQIGLKIMKRPSEGVFAPLMRLDAVLLFAAQVILFTLNFFLNLGLSLFGMLPLLLALEIFFLAKNEIVKA